MPPELLELLGLELPLIRRDPHYFLPTTGERYLLLGSDLKDTERQLSEFFSEPDLHAYRALQAELDGLREDVAPSWLREPLSIEDTADRYVRPGLQQVFVELCRGSVGSYLERFGFQSELLQAMYAVTDGFTGLCGDWNTPGSGMNFLIHNMCRLPGSDGTWMVVRGGMGTVSSALAEAASKAGASIELSTPVARVELDKGAVAGVVTEAGELIRASRVLVNADPVRMLSLLDGGCPVDQKQQIEGYRKPGTTLKLNLCLQALPRFTCLPESRGQHGGTIHLLPQENTLQALERAFAQSQAGQLPDFPAIEWYIHTGLDPSLQDAQGRHSSALFVQWVPNKLARGDWAQHEASYTSRLLQICDRFAPGTSELVVDAFALTPPKIESHFGISEGHIHHVDNSFGFADRLPYRLPVPGLYSCSAGCHPGGSVIGAAGHNAARALLAD